MFAQTNKLTTLKQGFKRARKKLRTRSRRRMCIRHTQPLKMLVAFLGNPRGAAVGVEKAFNEGMWLQIPTLRRFVIVLMSC